MGASFRNIDEILELAGCDLLTIAPKFLEQLENDDSILKRKLIPSQNLSILKEKLHLDEMQFREMLKADRMAHQKLEEGINNFSKAIEDLEVQLNERLLFIESDANVALSA